jgi:pimeloyl-ACP methyl ester carboxylesterase/quercetin dioxygenase-like cupin family protein
VTNLRKFCVPVVGTVCSGLIALSTTLVFAELPATSAPQSRFAEVNGTRLHYRIDGQGEPVVLLHGYTQDSHMWLPLMAELAKTHTVIAPDLRGFGQSSTPTNGYTKAGLAQDVHALLQTLGHQRVRMVGHDIGLMVAYAYAAQYPAEVDRIVLMDAFLPGVGNWKDVWLLRDLWHFHFHGEVPLALVKGRERTYFEHFWNDFAADRHHSIPERDRRLYARAYAQPGHMRAGFEVFRAFEQDAQDFARFAQTPLPMPMLVLTGEKGSGEFLIQQGRLVATNVEGVVIRGSGHWLMEEAPEQVMPKLVAFLNASSATSPGLRLTASEIESLPPTGSSTGTSGVSGIRTRVLTGNPGQSGPYTIQLSVPANTRIEAHDHPDDRLVSVISGTWHFGYGTSFDEQELKELPPGSFYTEPPNKPHFARTGGLPAVIQITGFGPSGTRYHNQTATK